MRSRSFDLLRGAVLLACFGGAPACGTDSHEEPASGDDEARPAATSSAAITGDVPAGTISVSSEQAAHAGAAAGDGSPSTYWASQAGAAPLASESISMQWGTAQAFNYARLVPRCDNPAAGAAGCAELPSMVNVYYRSGGQWFLWAYHLAVPTVALTIPSQGFTLRFGRTIPTTGIKVESVTMRPDSVGSYSFQVAELGAGYDGHETEATLTGASASSQFSGSSWFPTNASDGHPNSAWSSRSWPDPNHTEWIAVSFASQAINYVRYVPRVNPWVPTNGVPARVDIEVTTNGVDWQTVRSNVALQPDTDAQWDGVSTRVPLSGVYLYFGKRANVIGARVKATTLRSDGGGGYLFQAGEVMAGYWSRAPNVTSGGTWSGPGGGSTAGTFDYADMNVPSNTTAFRAAGGGIYAHASGWNATTPAARASIASLFGIVPSTSSPSNAVFETGFAQMLGDLSANARPSLGKVAIATVNGLIPKTVNPSAAEFDPTGQGLIDAAASIAKCASARASNLAELVAPFVSPNSSEWVSNPIPWSDPRYDLTRAIMKACGAVATDSPPRHYFVVEGEPYRKFCADELQWARDNGVFSHATQYAQGLGAENRASPITQGVDFYAWTHDYFVDLARRGALPDSIGVNLYYSSSNTNRYYHPIGNESTINHGNQAAKKLLAEWDSWQ